LLKQVHPYLPKYKMTQVFKTSSCNILASAWKELIWLWVQL